MHPKKFIDKIDETKIVAAISRAEQATSGEIRVCVSHRCPVDALAAAKERFLQLGMVHTQHRNAVLLYFIPRANTFAIWGDIGVHEKCTHEFWQTIAANLSPLLKADRFAEAVEESVLSVGQMLARHFPPGLDDRNDLPNAIVED